MQVLENERFRVEINEFGAELTRFTSKKDGTEYVWKEMCIRDRFMDERLQKQLNFILEIDKEKNIFRQTHLSGHGRRENDAEHAWQMCLRDRVCTVQPFASSSVRKEAKSTPEAIVPDER